MITIKNIRGKATLYYSYKGEVLRISTGILFTEKNKPDNTKIIARKRALLDKLINDHTIKYGQKPQVKWLLSNIDQPTTGPSTTLLEYFEEFYLFKDQSGIKPQSIKDYSNLRTALKQFDASKKNKLLLSDINEDWFNQFQMFLSRDRHLNSNTIRKRILCFRTFMKWVSSKSYYEFPLSLKTMKIIEDYDIDIVSLDQSELRELSTMVLTGMKDRVRDLFLFMCFTGMRYSDLQTLNKAHITSGVIEKRAVKTDILFRVPLSTEATRILEKYEYLLPVYTNQVFNRVIKDVLRSMVSMNEKVIYTRRTFKREETLFVEKWRLCSAHTGRRTFIGNCVASGITIRKIMDMTSHRKINTLLKYMEKFGKLDQKDVEKLNFI